MQCFVYKGEAKEDHYLYLPTLREELSDDDLPTALLAMLGDLSLVVQFELDENRELAQADASTVIKDIQEQGFYLQMPKKDMAAEEARYFN